MNIKQYLDSTYLKTAAQANLSEKENTEVVKNCIQEAIDNDFKLIMIRPDKVVLAKKMIQESNSKVTIGTVIDFPLGNGTLEAKLAEAKQAIENGVDDLDYVLDTNNITVYNIVYLNEFDSTFLIEPINEAIYKGVING